MYDVICHWEGCADTFTSKYSFAKWCPKHQKPAKLLAMRKKSLAVKNIERVCETEGCKNTFAGDRRRRFCHKCAYSRAHERREPRTGPRRRYVKGGCYQIDPPKFARRLVTINSFGRMTIAQLLKTWSQWRSGKVDFVK